MKHIHGVLIAVLTLCAYAAYCNVDRMDAVTAIVLSVVLDAAIVALIVTKKDEQSKEKKQ